MKKLILTITIFLSLTGEAFTACKEARDMGVSPDGEQVFMRCENAEAICYMAGAGVSCFRK